MNTIPCASSFTARCGLARRAAGMLPACAGLTLAVAGCASPIAARAEEDLRRSVAESVRRELAESERLATPRKLEREPRIELLEIREEDLDEIEREYSLEGYLERLRERAPDRDPIEPLLDVDLFGRPHEVVGVSLERAVRAAVAHNLDLQLARFEPAVREAEVVAAQAAFDWLFFAGTEWRDIEDPRAGQTFGDGTSRGIVRDSTQAVGGSVGLRRSLVGGGAFSARQELLYTDVRTSFFGTEPQPNPSARVDLVFDFEQPLLRGAGTDVTLAQVRLSRNAERRAVVGLKDELIRVVTDTEIAYWDLLRAYRELVIRQRLLERGESVRDDIRIRRIQDARQAQIADAVARVERRKGDLLIARTALRRASDRLKLLMNEPSLPVGSEVLILPVDQTVDEPIVFSLFDAVSTAIAKRPDLERSILDIDDASIRQTVADNLRLPALDFRAGMTLTGFEREFGSAYGTIGEDRFIDQFLLGLFFERPLGNRGPEAEYRRSRLERMRSVVAYRRDVQNAVLAVKEALDAVVTNHQLIEQARLSRIAAGEVLRTLGVEKELTEGGFTVERLNIELNQQESLAGAEISEINAMVDYNTAIASLHAAMGTALERNRIDFVVPDADQLLEGQRAIDYRLPDPPPAPTKPPARRNETTTDAAP